MNINKEIILSKIMSKTIQSNWTVMWLINSHCLLKYLKHAHSVLDLKNIIGKSFISSTDLFSNLGNTF